MSDFGNRLAKNLKRLRPWAKRHDITCFRVYDRDLPGVPLALDVYEDHLHASVFEPRHGIEGARVDAWLTEAREALGISPERTVVKRRAPGARYERAAREGGGDARFAAREGGLRFWVNLVDYLDTGLFLDHRITRDRVRAESAGKRVLNLFAYTGAFSVYAAAGGASRTVSVDLSPTYARWAEDNFELNGLDRGDVVVADAVTWLEGCRETFDLAVIDPPTVSVSKRAAGFEVQRDHRRLIERAIDRLSPGGAVYFSTNFQGFTLDAIEARVVVDITSGTVPFDFPRRPPIHRAWRIEK